MKNRFLSAGFFGIWYCATWIFVNFLYPFVFRVWSFPGAGAMFLLSSLICWVLLEYGDDVPLEVEFLEKIQNFTSNFCFLLAIFLPLPSGTKVVGKINNGIFSFAIVFFLDPLIATMHFKGRNLGEGLHFKEDWIVFSSSVLACNALWLLRACLIISGANLFF